MQTGQTSNVDVVAYTPQAEGTFRCGVYVTITAVAVDVIIAQVTYTDETGTSRTKSFFPQGLTSANLAATGAFVFPTMDIRSQAGSAITIQVAVTVGGGSITYNAGGSIEMLR